MDLATYLQAFESRMSSYTGDDPLDHWDKFVQFLESRLPREEQKSLCMVLQRLVEVFLTDQRYQNDPRYISHCVKYAGLLSDPVEVFISLHRYGVGDRAAPFHIDWALHYEKRGEQHQAERVFQQAIEKRAQPEDALMHQYRLCQERIAAANAQTSPSDQIRQPLLQSQLMNQNTGVRDNIRDVVQTHCQDPEAPSAPPRMVCIISRSENNPKRRSNSNSTSGKALSMYLVEELQCEGSELSFEELRARRYFAKLSLQEEQRQQVEEHRRFCEEVEEVQRLKKMLEDLDNNLDLHSAGCMEVGGELDTAVPYTEVFPSVPEMLDTHSCTNPLPRALLSTSQSDLECVVEESEGPNQDTGALSASLIQRNHCSLPEEEDEAAHLETDPNGDGACAALSHAHVTPNTSLGFIQATPSRVLPSPTVNTREALGVIMDMFQAPTLLQESMFNTMAAPEDSFQRSCRISSAPPRVQAASATPFMVYQDTEEQENACSDPATMKSSLPRALMALPMPRGSEDESTVWGARNISVGSCPSLTVDFRLSAHLASTPLQRNPPLSWDKEIDENAALESVETADENPFLRQPKKLSPIMEQSPADDKPSELPECTIGTQGTIVGEGVSITQQSHGVSLSQSGRNPLAALSFPDHTTMRSQDESKVTWSIYTSPEKEQTPTEESKVTWGIYTSPGIEQKPNEESKVTWNIYRSPEKEQKPSEESKMTWNNYTSPEKEQTLSEESKVTWNVYTSPEKEQKPSEESKGTWSIYTSPEKEQTPSEDSKVTWNIYRSPRKEQKPSEESKVTWNVYRSPVKEQKTCEESTWGICRSLKKVQKRSEESKLVWNINRSPEKSKQPEASLRTWNINQEDEPKTNYWPLQSQVSQNEEEAEDLNLKRQLRRGSLISSDPATMKSSLPRALMALPMPRGSEDESTVWGARNISVGSCPSLTVDFRLSAHLASTPLQRNPPLSWDKEIGSLMNPGEPLGLNSFQSESSNQNPQQPSKTVTKWAMNIESVEEQEAMITEQPFRRSEMEIRDSFLKSPLPKSKEASNVEADLEVFSSPNPGSRSPCLPLSPMDTFRARCLNLVSDPWDEDVIESLLSNLQPPLSSNPNLTVWSCRLPTVNPKMTVNLAGESLRVDSVLGQGAFAVVYQATNLTTSHKLFLKVQKPANIWEFYINEQLNTRLSPSTRHLFNSIHSAQLFNNGSVLIGQIHTCGTLLSAVNLYRSRGEKLIPQPLVLYFTVCILQIVELLHQAQIIHADIKPDNFILGESFLENEYFTMENLHHGLVLIDLGQSIDMRCFPEGTAFTACCRTSGFQCTEMLSGRPWNYQTDYFGIAGTVYCMLFGSYMQVKEERGIWKTNGVFKRMAHADLWQDFFHTLMNVPDCFTLPSLSDLRLRLNKVLQKEYGSKLRSLKSRLIVQILEARSSRR